MIIGVEGSPRRNGNSHRLLEAVLAGAQKANQLGEAIHLRDYQYKPCVGCEKCRRDFLCTRFNDDMSLFYPKIMEAKAMVLISPVHNYNVTAWIKAFLDRLYCFYEFNDERPRGWSSRLAGQGKKAVIGAIAEQQSKQDMGITLDAMRMPLEALGFEVVEEIAVLGLFDKGIIAKHEDILAQGSEAGRSLAAALGNPLTP